MGFGLPSTATQDAWVNRVKKAIEVSFFWPQLEMESKRNIWPCWIDMLQNQKQDSITIWLNAAEISIINKAEIPVSWKIPVLVIEEDIDSLKCRYHMQLNYWLPMLAGQLQMSLNTRLRCCNDPLHNMKRKGGAAVILSHAKKGDEMHRSGCLENSMLTFLYIAECSNVMFSHFLGHFSTLISILECS